MSSRYKARRALPPLDHDALEQLALRYVGKYATTRARLRHYLSRKVRERGWESDRPPDLEALANRLAELGFVDDAAYALSKFRTLSARGLGKRRLTQSLRLAGVEEADSEAAAARADLEAVEAALRFAKRRRIGPYASTPADFRQCEKWISALVRAGHGIGLARAIAKLEPGAEIDVWALGERLGAAEL